MQPSEVLTRTELGLTQSVDQLTWSNNRKNQTVALNILNKVHISHFQLIKKNSTHIQQLKETTFIEMYIIKRLIQSKLNSILLINQMTQ